jgi:hypothetical protein
MALATGCEVVTACREVVPTLRKLDPAFNTSTRHREGGRLRDQDVIFVRLATVSRVIAKVAAAERADTQLRARESGAAAAAVGVGFEQCAPCLVGGDGGFQAVAGVVHVQAGRLTGGVAHQRLEL